MKTLKDLYPDYNEDWNFYFSKIDGEEVSIVTDFNLSIVAPVKEFPICVTIKIEFNKTLDDKLHTHTVNIYNSIEDEIDDRFSKSCNFIKAGAVTYSDKKYYVYYFAEESGIIDILDSIFEKYDKDYEVAIDKEPNWDRFFDTLEPDCYEREEVYNRKLIDYLKFQNDNGQTPREVNFWLYFSNEEGRTSFIKSLDSLNSGNDDFKVKYTLETDEELPYGVVISRFMKLRQNEIDEISHLLITIAVENGGEFDGWESELRSNK